MGRKKESCEEEQETKHEVLSREKKICSHCLAFWLNECPCIFYRIKSLLLEESILQNPAHNTLQTSISEVKNLIYRPALKQLENRFDFLMYF